MSDELVGVMSEARLSNPQWPLTRLVEELAYELDQDETPLLDELFGIIWDHGGEVTVNQLDWHTA